MPVLNVLSRNNVTSSNLLQIKFFRLSYSFLIIFSNKNYIKTIVKYSVVTSKINCKIFFYMLDKRTEYSNRKDAAYQ